MEVLIVLALAAGILYGWLAGSWFARVLVFLMLTVCFGMVIGATLPAWDAHTGINPLGFPIAGIAAWFLAGIPIYRQRHQKRRTKRASQSAYPLHWTLSEINAYERDATAAAESRPIAHFPALRLR